MSLEKILPRNHASPETEDHWIPLSDLMTGLMLMFLLIAMVFMVKVEAESNKLKDAKNQAEQQTEDIKTAKAQAEKQAEKLGQIGVLYSRIRYRNG